jgi:hypothetical protein
VWIVQYFMVGSDDGEVVDSGGGNDQSVGRVFVKRRRQSGRLDGYLRSDGQDAGALRRQGNLKPSLKRGIQDQVSHLRLSGHLQQGDVARESKGCWWISA